MGRRDGVGREHATGPSGSAGRRSAPWRPGAPRASRIERARRRPHWASPWCAATDGRPWCAACAPIAPSP